MAKLLITLEGIDGSGKTSVAQALDAALKSHGHDVLTLREPGTTQLGEGIRTLLENEEEISGGTRALLFIASFCNTAKYVIHPAKGYVVVDRWYDSLRAYQGTVVHDSRLKTILTNVNIIPNHVPDVTFLLDIPVHISRARCGIPKDELEEHANKILEDVHANYLRLAEDEPDRIIVIDASKSLAEVEREVIELTLAIVEEYGQEQ